MFIADILRQCQLEHLFVSSLLVWFSIRYKVLILNELWSIVLDTH